MAKNTPLNFRNLFIYQVFVRNHTESGDFKGLIRDLDRIKSLGTDVLYLMPVNPVGKVNRKGTLGSNYSISNYRTINPEYGSLEDFKAVIEETHRRGMKFMIDIVFHHTAHDAVLLKTHPEFYFYRNGKNVNKVGDWSDIIDLDYNNRGLWDELIDTLKYYANLGVDGFRCDVASLVPLDFWLEARKAVAEINPNFIWLAESVHPEFIKFIRSHHFGALSDSEVFQAFDILYDYDIFDLYSGFIKGKTPLHEYIQAINRQEIIYPANYVKLRFLENHDQARVAGIVHDLDKLKQLTAFIFFLKGATMMYAGEEALAQKTPSLFDLDQVDWSGYDQHNISTLIAVLSEIKRSPIMANGNFTIDDLPGDIVVMNYEGDFENRTGIFNFGLETENVAVNVPDGVYENLIDHSTIPVKNGYILAGKAPVIFDSHK